MGHDVLLTPFFEKQLRILKNKDKMLFERLIKKLKEIRQNPNHYKPLKNILKGKRRAHINPFVIIFEIKENIVIFHYVKHHDKAY
ncbi:MAG: type II toxin-antitoxin system RelE/ParE family toxin [Nanoarchaeota archaeon]|nr:type II toxin-antitoxin system RelE/ParE family toxin [Nanoarchaeota archaeon]MBU1270208.1 type II toxin-antitoxin system RelE/ParE family toxin [Nanoarchaeota archaeon]MBU1604624.1 type II toxin-antitoxin system RelE/ParE family toxin [Nanoarchaeota archaeon]MBU2443542.1 type II toxin-antitoxin system RelE/ParE family toxin [Nanoarchaeota archaeon]